MRRISIKIMTAVVSVLVCQMSALGAYEKDLREKKRSWFTRKKVTVPSTVDVTTMIVTLTPDAASRLHLSTFIVYPDYPEGDNRTIFCRVLLPEDRRQECLVKWHFPKDQRQINVRFPWSKTAALRALQIDLPSGHPTLGQDLVIAIGTSEDGSLTWTPNWEPPDLKYTRGFCPKGV